MTLVCIVCDVAKPTAEDVRTPSMCMECARVTGNRRVARDSEAIAPGSCMTFGEQRSLWVLSAGERMS